MVQEKIKVNVHVYIFGMFFICMIIVVGSISYYFHPISFNTGKANILFTSAANWEIKNSVVVNDTVNFCRPIGINKDLVECVVENVGKYYDYTARNNIQPIVIKVDDFNSEGYIALKSLITSSSILVS